jgi:hypothetical protein
MLRSATLSTMGILALGVSACSGSGRGDGQGGSGPAASGGGSSSGGVVGTSGSVGAGGIVGVGGSVGSGGNLETTSVGTGGIVGSGGVVGTGGRIGSGGTTGRGGTVGNGGVVGTGGATLGNGGTSTTSTTPPGACQESTCGSHKWACWPVPTPPSEKLAHPQSYTDLGNGAVRDNVTCLVWEKANPATQGTWQASSDRCAALGTSSYAGFNDWRLPTRMEMASLMDQTLGRTGYASPPFTTTSGAYATGSYWWETIQGINGANLAWGYGANGMTSNAYSLAGTNFVTRCVRGNGTGEAPSELAVEPANHYTVVNGETTDNYTGLVWQSGFSPTLMAWADAPAYCTSLSLNGHTGFRVPTLGELSSTVNEARVGNAVVLSAFPGTPNGCKDPKYWFWAAESQSATADWGLSYCDGFTGTNVGATANGVNDWDYFPTANVRCVRNGP